jgi:5-methyltetrahydropteroyltriglutamate--homocysteine methyltransferase
LALRDQEEAGVDIVTDGLIRWSDPVSHLAGKLEGTRTDGLLRFFDTNFYFRQPVVQGKVERIRPLVLDEFMWATQRSAKPVKPVLTGPYTLARLSTLASKKTSILDLVIAYAEALGAEVAELVGAGARLIQVDEPCMLKYPADIVLAGEALAIVASHKGPAELALATYFGDAAPVYGALQALPFDTLIWDFTYSPLLPEIIETQGSTRRVGFGVLDGRNTKLEDQGPVAHSVERMLVRIGADRCYLTTSCGLEHLPRDRARLKLRHLASLKKSLLGEVA